MGPHASDPQADSNELILSHFYGGVGKRFNPPVLKTGVVQATVGSNPTPSATSPQHTKL